MKVFIYVLLVLALGLLIFNSTKLNFDQLFVGDSKTAVIGVVACACVILLLIILLMSRAIQKKASKR